MSLLSASRHWHKKIASFLFVFFFFIAITGLMLGWKPLFTRTVFENRQIIPSVSLRKWLPLDSLEIMASRTLSERTSSHFVHSDRIELRPAKGYINFVYKNNYNIQVDGATGATLLIEQKNGGLIQDIHDGAIMDGWFSSKSAVSKKIYTTIIGLALLFLTVSGFYLWYKPARLKQLKTKA